MVFLHKITDLLQTFKKTFTKWKYKLNDSNKYCIATNKTAEKGVVEGEINKLPNTFFF